MEDEAGRPALYQELGSHLTSPPIMGIMMDHYTGWSEDAPSWQHTAHLCGASKPAPGDCTPVYPRDTSASLPRPLYCAISSSLPHCRHAYPTTHQPAAFQRTVRFSPSQLSHLHGARSTSLQVSSSARKGPALASTHRHGWPSPCRSPQGGLILAGAVPT